MQIEFNKSNRKNKKYYVSFFKDTLRDPKGKKIKTVHFGDNRYEDFTIHKDNKRKELYLERHKRENWNNYMTAGSLSRYILWNKTTIKQSLNDYMKRFNLTLKT